MGEDLKDTLITMFGIIVVTFIILGITVLCCSCFHLHKPVKPIPDIIPSTPQEILNKVVYKTNWLVALSIIGASLSMAAYINGSKAAIPIGIGSLTALGLSLATIRYASWLAGGSVIAAILIFIATVVWKNTALKQLIMGIQFVKETKPIDRTQVNNVLTEFQNKDTTKLVLATKTDLKLKGKI